MMISISMIYEHMLCLLQADLLVRDSLDHADRNGIHECWESVSDVTR